MITKSINTVVKQGVRRSDETHQKLSLTPDATQRGPQTLGDVSDMSDGVPSDVP